MSRDLGTLLNDPLLPKPPSESEKYSYCNPDSVGLSLSTLFLAIAFGWGSWLFIQGKGAWVWPYGAFASVVCFGLLFSAFLYLLPKRLDVEWWEHKKRWAYNDAQRYPTVDVFLPNCGEDLALLASNLYYVSRIDYPCYRVWVLDDAGRDEVRALADRYGFTYRHREGSEYKKSGNMRAVFPESSGELVLVLDADFAPHESILRELCWMFLEHSTLGIVQTPHYFRVNKRDNMLKAGGSQLQSPFFRVIQSARDRVGQGSAICCGSNAVYRRAALEPFGGSAAVNRSEDVATGLNVISAGYTLKYVPLCLASGLSPSSLRSYVSMIARWTGGCFEIRFSKFLWNPRIPWSVRFAYLGSALAFFIAGFGIVGYAVPGVANLLFFPQALSWANYAFILPAIACLVIVRARWASEPWGPSLFYAAFVTNYTSMVAIFDFIRGANVPWIATGQKYSKGGSYSRVLWAIQWIPLVGFALCLAGIYKNWELIDSAAYIPTTLLWGLKLWASRLVLKQHMDELQIDLTMQAISEHQREELVRQILSNKS